MNRKAGKIVEICKMTEIVPCLAFEDILDNRTLLPLNEIYESWIKSQLKFK